jgi:hypothetical protein
VFYPQKIRESKALTKHPSDLNLPPSNHPLDKEQNMNQIYYYNIEKEYKEESEVVRIGVFGTYLHHSIFY